MINFQYARANDVADAVRQIAADPDAKFIAGGTNLVDLMKVYVARPSRLIDISRLPLKTVDEIRELMSGNICRCGAYRNIVAAIRQAMNAIGGKP